MSFKLRITLVTAAFLICLSVVVSVYTLRAQSAQLYAESRKRVEMALSMLSEVSAPALQKGDLVALAYIADRAAEGQPERVCIADRRGLIVADSQHKLYDRGIDIITEAERTGKTRVTREGDIWEGAVPVRDDLNRSVGSVYVSFSSKPLTEALTRVTERVAVFAALFILLGTLAAYGLGRYLGTCMSPLLEGIRRTARGKFDGNISPVGMTELDEIGREFSRMARLVGRQVQDLATLNQLATKLMESKTLDEFATTLTEACNDLVDGQVILLTGDPRSGRLNVVTGDMPNRPVAPGAAALRFATGRRVLSIGKEADLEAGCEIVEGLGAESGVVAALTTPREEIVGLLMVSLDSAVYPAPDQQSRLAVQAVATVAAPILAALERVWTQQKAMDALKEILLPGVLPQPEDVEVYAHYEPLEKSSGLGGDYYDLLQLGDGSWAIAIGDVAGKGIEAGRYTAMAKYAVRSFALEYRSPSKTVQLTSEALSAQMSDQWFITLFCAVLDVPNSRLSYCCAGHPPGLLYSAATASIRELEVGGGVVGLKMINTFAEDVVSVSPGDLLVLYTDGVMEARCGRELYGLERLHAVVQATAKLPLKDIARSITEDVRAFAQDVLSDDIALLLVRIADWPDNN